MWNYFVIAKVSENVPVIVSDYPSVGLDCAHLLPQDVRIDKQLQAGLRVTVQLSPTHSPGIFAWVMCKPCALYQQFSDQSWLSRTAEWVSVSVHHPQRANTAKVWWWLLMCPGLKVGSTGVTVSVWLPVSVRLTVLTRFLYSFILFQLFCNIPRN